MDVMRKLEILSDAAKYDASCSSSGSNRANTVGGIGNAAAATGICHSWSQDGRCISLLKILYTNKCIHDCKYCINRSSNEVERISFTPKEVEKISRDTLVYVYQAFLSEAPGIELKLFKYIQLGFKIGNKVNDLLTDLTVNEVHKYSRN